ncbi:MAG: type II secretion system protein GspM, partial [Dehalococcoidia bacterium]
MRISRRERAVLILGIAFVAALALYFLAIEPMVEGQRQVRSQLEAKMVLLEKYNRILGQRQALEGERERLKTRLALLESKLLRGDKPPLAAAELQKIVKLAAAKAEVDISSERILDPLVRGHYTEVPVEINVKCSVTRLTRFLFEIENSPRYLSVRELNVRADHRITPEEVNTTLVVIGL